jgi:methionine-rich copper-binding protein CopC
MRRARGRGAGRRGGRFGPACAAVALATLATSTWLATPASAHARLLRSSPAEGATLSSAPHEVALVFDDVVDHAASTVEITDGSGAVVSAGPVRGAGPELVQPLAGLPVDGRVSVSYRVVAADGDSSVGSLTFVVDGGPPDLTSGTRWLMVGIAVTSVLVLVLIEGSLAVRRRRGAGWTPSRAAARTAPAASRGNLERTPGRSMTASARDPLRVTELVRADRLRHPGPGERRLGGLGEQPEGPPRALRS